MFIVPLQPPVAYTLVSPSDAVALLKCTILCPKAERNEQFFSEVIIVPVKEFEIRESLSFFADARAFTDFS